MILSYTDEEIKRRKKQVASSRNLSDRFKFEEEFDASSLGLSNTDLDTYNKNPHIRQVFANRKPFLRPNIEIDESLRFITEDTPSIPYQRRQGEAKTVEHWGQRKLLMSEIDFLTQYIEPGNGYTVLYVGAGPGRHLDYLMFLFPSVTEWIFYDPKGLEMFPLTEKTQIHPEYFTDKDAEGYAKLENLLFISDIRSIHDELPFEEIESGVVRDMTSQMNWHLTMKPIASCLKFRLPYTDGKTVYLKGKPYFQVWGGGTTSETRLIVSGDEMTEYDNLHYSNVMYYFNTITRTTYYEHDVDKFKSGYDHCYDCSTEIYIIKKYMKKYKIIHDGCDHKTICKLIDKMSLKISRACSSKGRTLRIIPKRFNGT